MGDVINVVGFRPFWLRLHAPGPQPLQQFVLCKLIDSLGFFHVQELWMSLSMPSGATRNNQKGVATNYKMLVLNG